jgi:glycosyltransferase involved in cell wall biosynthesis
MAQKGGSPAVRAGPLRIVHFITEPCVPEAPNGVVKAVFYLSTAQRALGYEVIVAADLDLAESAGTVDATERPYWRQMAAQLARATGQTSGLLVEHLLRFQPDIVHFHSIHVPENVWFAARLRRAGISYCVTIHGGLSRLAHRRRWVRKLVFKWLCERTYLNGAAFIHALTPLESMDIRGYGTRAPIVDAPNGIDLDALPQVSDRQALFAAAPWLAGRRVFMSMGRLDPVPKGLD